MKSDRTRWFVPALLVATYAVTATPANAQEEPPALLWFNTTNFPDGDWLTWNLNCSSSYVGSTTLTNSSGQPATFPGFGGLLFPPPDPDILGMGAEADPGLVLLEYGVGQRSIGILEDWTVESNGRVNATVLNTSPPAEGWYPLGQRTIATGNEFNPYELGMLWYSPNGTLSEWILSGDNVVATQTPNFSAPSNIVPSYAGDSGGSLFTADFDGDGTSDMVYFNQSTGILTVTLMNANGTKKGTQTLAGQCAPSGCQNVGWGLYAAGDLNCDAYADLAWWNRSTGQVEIWYLNGKGGLLSYPIITGNSCGGTCQQQYWLAGIVGFPVP
jgi:hypothetical protein